MNYTYKLDDVEEIKRLQTLLSYNILDTPPQEEFDNLVKLISIICKTPIAIISMVDDKRQWYKAKVGISQNEVPLAETFCQYTLQQDEILEIPDAITNDLVKNNTHVKAKDGIRFYAGLNLKASNGAKIGTLCVVDSQPKELNEDQKNALRLIADQTMVLLEARKKNKELTDELEEVIINKVKETQRQLLQKKTEYYLLLRAIRKSSAVIEFSPEGEIRSINDNYLDIIGYSREDVLGKKNDIFLDEDQKIKNAEFWASLRSGKFHSGKLKRKHKNGSSVWIQATYNPITDQNNKVIRIIKIAQDITKEIEAEKTLKKAKELAENLNIQKDHFIANISHEIRTPIHAILGFTELLLEKEQDFGKRSYLESVKTAGDNLLYIINDILDLSKIEAGIIQLEQEPFDLLVVVKNVFSILHLKAHQKKISFTYTIHPELISTLLGDKNRLTQILINLLGNAIKFTSTGSVELYMEPISFENGTSTVQFKVADTGIGIPEDKLDAIFDRFSQAEQDTARKFGGTGLGLNISRQLIERQGGSIWAKSKKGKGSVFNFYIPFKIGKVETQPEKKDRFLASPKKSLRILLCEDNELNQRLIRAILTEKSHSIDLAENGEKGLMLLQKNDYDLILMDIQMPHMDGYQTTRRIRQEIKSKVPIIALTANFMISEKAKCQHYGMNDYLAKPFAKEDLLQKINSLVEQKEKSQEIAWHIEPNQSEVISLSNLEELSGGDKDFQKEMMTLFIDQAEKMYENLKEFSEVNNIIEIKATAHKMKTSFGIIGADLRFLENLEKSTEADIVTPEFLKNLGSLQKQLDDIFIILNKLINAPHDESPTC